MVKRVFVDTNPFIYLLGEIEPYYNKVAKFLADSIRDDCEFYTSTITDAEILSKLYIDNDYNNIEKYKKYLEQLEFLKCYINENVAQRAAELRAKYNSIKLPDALQLAAGIECDCDVFLTNDKQLRQVQEANVLYLGDL